MNSAFKLHDLSFRRSGNVILCAVNWEAKLGENWVLLGANGIGKSTLVNIISTRLFPTSGQVDVLGERLGKTDVFELRKQIGVLGADIGNAFPKTETCINVVALGKSGNTGTWGGANSIDGRDAKDLTPENLEQARDLLDQFGVGNLAGRFWGVLSQGERKRVMMARTMMGDPKILLLDEPTAGLDLAGREQVISTLNKIAREARLKRDKMVLLVNHNVEEIPPAFDKIAIMGSATSSKYISDANNCVPQIGISDASNRASLHQKSGTILYQGDLNSTLTSANLSEAYGIKIAVERMPNLRYFASASVILEHNSPKKGDAI